MRRKPPNPSTNSINHGSRPHLPPIWQGVGSIFGELPGLCGTRLPGAERVVAVGNSFGRGPLVYHFPAAAVDALRQRSVPPACSTLALRLLAWWRFARPCVSEPAHGPSLQPTPLAPPWCSPTACRRAAGGDEAAAALEAELFRVAALHAVQHVQGDLQGSVK